MIDVSSELFIDRGFKPELKDYLIESNPAGNKRTTFFSTWGICSTGLPAPTPRYRNTRAALWHGRRVNAHGELPVFVAEVDRHRTSAFKIHESRIYVGVGKAAAPEVLIDDTDNTLINSLAESAEYPLAIDPHDDRPIPAIESIVRALTELIPMQPLPLDRSP